MRFVFSTIKPEKPKWTNLREAANHAMPYTFPSVAILIGMLRVLLCNSDSV